LYKLTLSDRVNIEKVTGMNVVINESIQTQQLPGVAAVNYTREKMYVRVT
jgi:hypothetical protein